jgi:hypothetical protein
MTNTIKIYRSKQAEQLDEYFSGSAEQLRAIYTTVLRRYDDYEDRPLLDLVTDFEGQTDVPWHNGAATEFEEHWSAGRDAVLKAGYREAFTLALEHDPPVPLETFWVTGAGDDFELHISDGEQHVTVFMVVPPGDSVPLGSIRARAKSWVVTAGDRTPDPGRPAAQELAAGIVKVEVSGNPGSGD